MDKAIERDMEETVDVLKNKSQCLRTGCWLGKTEQCGKVNGKWRKECLWDLRDMYFDVQKHAREAEVYKKAKGKVIPRRK